MIYFFYCLLYTVVTHFQCSSIIPGLPQHVRPDTRGKHTAQAIYSPPVALVTWITWPRYPWCIFSTTFPPEIYLYCRETSKHQKPALMVTLVSKINLDDGGNWTWDTNHSADSPNGHTWQWMADNVKSMLSFSLMTGLCALCAIWSGSKLVLTQSRWVFFAVHTWLLRLCAQKFTVSPEHRIPKSEMSNFQGRSRRKLFQT